MCKDTLTATHSHHSWRNGAWFAGKTGDSTYPPPFPRPSGGRFGQGVHPEREHGYIYLSHHCSLLRVLGFWVGCLCWVVGPGLVVVVSGSVSGGGSAAWVEVEELEEFSGVVVVDDVVWFEVFGHGLSLSLVLSSVLGCLVVR